MSLHRKPQSVAISKPSFAYFVDSTMATFDSIQTGNIHIDQGDRTEKNLSPLALDRVQYKPRYPDCLEDPSRITVGCFCFDLRR